MGISDDGMNITPSTGDDNVANRDSANHSRAAGSFGLCLARPGLRRFQPSFASASVSRERRETMV